MDFFCFGLVTKTKKKFVLGNLLWVEGGRWDWVMNILINFLNLNSAVRKCSQIRMIFAFWAGVMTLIGSFLCRTNWTRFFVSIHDRNISIHRKKTGLNYFDRISFRATLDQTIRKSIWHRYIWALGNGRWALNFDFLFHYCFSSYLFCYL